MLVVGAVVVMGTVMMVYTLRVAEVTAVDTFLKPLGFGCRDGPLKWRSTTVAPGRLVLRRNTLRRRMGRVVMVVMRVMGWMGVHRIVRGVLTAMAVKARFIHVIDDLL